MPTHPSGLASIEFAGPTRASTQGLTSEEAKLRPGQFGPNALKSAKRPSPAFMFARQFKDVMILILLAAAVISGLVADLKDTIVIVSIVFLNAVLGFAQEYRAERAIHALKSLATPSATAIRDGKRTQIPAAELVPGDIVLLETGQIVPADLRLIETAALRVDESTLTGESMPVEKSSDPASEPSSVLAGRFQSVFKGTVVTYGRGVGVAVATGMATELGKIAASIQGAVEVQTPLQRRLSVFGRYLASIALIICAIVFVSGVARGEAPLLMFLTAVSLAVAAIPEALPAVVAITLARGAGRMAKQQALIRRLAAVETLGSITYICSDKTGTLTANRMCVDSVYCDGRLVSVISRGGPWEQMLEAMALNNDAHVNNKGQVVGDPTESALYLAAAEAGVANEPLRLEYPRMGEIPFNSERKRMTTLHRRPDGGFVSYTKGAFELVLNRATSVATSQGSQPLARRQSSLQGVANEMAKSGLRVLAIGMREWKELPTCDRETLESDLVLLGFVGLIDPPRSGTAEAVRICKAAGIAPVMITGDHPGTAEAIAQRLGILGPKDRVLHGSALATLSRSDLERQVDEVRVYARVAPEQKLQIVQALQARGEVVAMTGDGVNDSPALKQADIGVAMGVNGTDVAKEVSSMVLLDDNFTTIVRAIREGRKIYDNIRRFVKYALTTNSAEIWTIFLAPFLGLPTPLLPIQILWINLMTDGLPGLALAAEPEEKDLMDRPPRHPEESILAHGLGFHIVWVGLLMASVTLLTETLFQDSTTSQWQTMVFTVLCLSQLGHVLAIRSERTSLFTQGLMSNLPLAAATVFTLAVQVLIIYTPALNAVLSTSPLTSKELSFSLLAASGVFFAVEVEKWVKRRSWRGWSK